MATLSDLFVTLSLRSEQFLSGMRDAQREAKEFEKSVKPLKDALSDVGKAAVGVGTALSAVGVPFALIAKSAIDSADALSKMSQRTGVTTETLSALKQQASLADVSMESLGIALKKQSQALENASSGSKQAQASFEKLGLSTKDLLKLSPDERFFAIAKAIEAVPDPAIKAGLAMEIWGKSGNELFTLLPALSGGIDQVVGSAKDFGQVITSEGGRAAEAFNDSLTNLRNAISGLFNSIANSGLLQGLTDLINRIASAVAGFGAAHPKVLAFIAVIGGLAAVLGPLIAAFGFIAQGVAAAIPILSSIGTTFLSLSTGAATLGGALGAVGAVLTGPIGIIAAITAGAAALIYFGATTESTRGIVLHAWESIKEAASEAFAGLSDLVRTVADSIIKIWQTWAPYVVAVIKSAGEVLKFYWIGLWEQWGPILEAGLNVAKSVLVGTFEIIGGIVKLLAVVLTGDVQGIADGIRTIFVGLWDAVTGIFRAGVALVINEIGALAGIAARVANAVGAEGLAQALNQVKEKAKATADNINGVNIALAGTATAADRVNQAVSTTSHGISELIAKMVEWHGKTGAQIEAEQKLAEEIDKLVDSVTAQRVEDQALIPALERLKGMHVDMRTVVDHLGKQTEDYVKILQRQGKEIPAVAQEIVDLIREQKALADANDRAVEIWEKYFLAINQNRKEIEAYVDAGQKWAAIQTVVNVKAAGGELALDGLAKAHGSLVMEMGSVREATVLEQMTLEKLNATARTDIATIGDFRKNVDALKGSMIPSRQSVFEMEQAIEELQKAGVPANVVVEELGDRAKALRDRMKELNIEVPKAINDLADLAESSGKAKNAFMELKDAAGHIFDDMLQKGFGGIGDFFKAMGLSAARDMFSTFVAGLFEPLKKKWDEWLTSINKGIRKLASDLASNLKDLFKGIGLQGSLLIGGGAALGGALGGVRGSIAGGLAGGALNEALKGDWLGAALAGVAALGTALTAAIGAGRREADRFVKEFQNPFGKAIGELFNSLTEAQHMGTLTTDQVKQARQQMEQLWTAFQEAASQATHGVGDQALQTLGPMITEWRVWLDAFQEGTDAAAAAAQAAEELAKNLDRLKDVESELADTRDQLTDAFAHKIDYLDNQIAESQRNIESWGQQISKINDDIGDAKNKLSDASYWQKVYNDSIRDEQQELQRVIDLRRSTEDRIAQLQVQTHRDQLEQILERAQASKDAKAIAAAQAALDEFENQVKQNERNQRLQELQRLQQQLPDIIRQQEEAQRAYESAKIAAVDSIKLQQQQLQEFIASKQRERDELQKNILVEQQRIQQLNLAEIATRAMMDLLGIERKSELEKINETIAALIERGAALEQERNALIELTGVSAAITDLYEKLKEAETQSESLSDASRDMSQQLDNGMDSVLDLTNGITRFADTAQDAAAIVKQFTTSLDNLNNTIPDVPNTPSGQPVNPSPVDNTPVTYNLEEAKRIINRMAEIRAMPGFGPTTTNPDNVLDPVLYSILAQKGILQEYARLLVEAERMGLPRDPRLNVYAFPHFAGGGVMPYDGMAYLHKDELIVPSSRASQSSQAEWPGSTTNIHFTIQAWDGEDVRRVVRSKIYPELRDMYETNSRGSRR